VVGKDAGLHSLVPSGREAKGSEVQRYTPEQALADLVMEVRAIHKDIRAIRQWVAFGGLVLLISVVLAACNALMGL